MPSGGFEITIKVLAMVSYKKIFFGFRCGIYKTR